MSRICDRSPCDRLLEVLGKYIFGSSPTGNGGFYFQMPGEDPAEIEIDYCPFCGTRLEEVPSVIVDKFMKPRRRRRATKINT
jgi:hypothetical protein